MIKRRNAKFENIVLGMLDESKANFKIKFAYFKNNPDKKELIDFMIFCCNKLGIDLNKDDLNYIKSKMNGGFVKNE